MEEILGGALGGGFVGALGAYVSAWLQRRARIHRNEALFARGAPTFKDVTWRPPVVPSAVVGIVVGGVEGALGVPLPLSALGGALVPAVLLVSAVNIALWPYFKR